MKKGNNKIKIRGGLFLVFEGADGGGKTTQAKLLADYLKKEKYEVVSTKEPGGDNGVCNKIREILLNPDYKGKISNRTELLLFEADRAQHADYIIRPALERGKIVISDRFDAATFAYQANARKVVSPEEFSELNDFAKKKLRPDFTFWLDLDSAEGLKRNVGAGKTDRFEQEKLEFHQKVREGYKKYFERLPESRYAKIDASIPVIAIHEEILQILKTKFKI